MVLPARMEMREGGARIIYKFDGDDCTLTFSGDRIEQLRRGEVNVKISFVCGQNTVCVIGDESLRGGYKVFTTRLEATVRSLGVNARIDYLSGDDGERVSVKIRALAAGGRVG